MRGIDLVVSIGANKKQVWDALVGEEILEQIERSRVEPLQIVEKQGERMLRTREDTDETAQQQLEASLGVGCRQFRNRLLLSDDEFEFRNQVNDKAAVRPQRIK